MIKLIEELTDEAAGGKAGGLKVLKKQGFSVPDAFVILHPDIDSLDENGLQKYLSKLGKGPKAVRSSAVSEDGAKASFAGQFETFLDLNTYDEIKDAIIRCVQAVENSRVKAYSDNLITDADLRISVIIQNMVEAKAAGVVFTVNPVNQRRDKVVINAVAGKGEALVSGIADAAHYEIFRSGSNVANEAKKNHGLLTETQLKAILDGALLAEKNQKQPIDMEWAVDQQDEIQWLQVRPVTTLHNEHYNELDTIQEASTDVWTLCNIGEMMPGVATPLTYSVSAKAIDYGMASLAAAYGAIRMNDYLAKTEPVYIQMFYNRLFINMTNMLDYPRHIWMNKAEDVHFAICGRTIPGLTAEPEGFWIKRFKNFIAQLIYSSRAKHHLKKLIAFTETVVIEESQDIATFYKNIEKAHPAMNIGFVLHLSASAQSGTVYSAFMRIMTDGKRLPSPEDHHIASLLLKNIPDIESADAVKSLDRLATEIQNDKEFAATLISSSPQKALEMLTQLGPNEHVEKFNLFLKRHGHRCVRESELREKTWGEDPLQIVSILQTRVGIKSSKHIDEAYQKLMLPKDLSIMKQLILKMLLPLGRKAVARRETSKAYSIKIVDITRKAYRKLAALMVSQGLLEDADQIYFLTHEELGKLISDKKPDWKEKANRRRLLLPETDAFSFDEVCYGKPEPLDSSDFIEISDGAMQGIPVSSGYIKAKARIVNTLEEASHLQPGEIMIASFTDIGWSPYFSIISGLITEIGSPLSHGAVVAREYGIPAVVGVKGIKKMLKTGDIIELDGRKGIITKCEE